MTQNGQNKIPGGYYLKARKIQESKISKAPPHVREIWDWLIKEANHKDSVICKRGQCFRTYKDIQEGLSWFIGYRKCKYKKHQCEIAMKWLKKATMVTTTKTTRGMLITILNYDYYQTPENYESYTKADTKATMKLQPPVTINKNNKKEKKEKKETIQKKYSPNSFEFELSCLLFQLISERRNGFKKPNLNKWASHIDGMIRIDKRDPYEIEDVIFWCQQDEFWQNNILSTEKLRKQYDQLALKMGKQKEKKGAGSSFKEWVPPWENDHTRYDPKRD